MLLVAKLDRLSRNVAFLAALMESRVRFQAVDLPAADEVTLHILAAVAQKEATAISTRTRDALAAKKARGFTLGTPANLMVAARARALASLQHNAQANHNNRQAAQLAGLLRATRASLRAIADQLNQLRLPHQLRQGLSPDGRPAPAGQSFRSKCCFRRVEVDVSFFYI